MLTGSALFSCLDVKGQFSRPWHRDICSRCGILPLRREIRVLTILVPRSLQHVRHFVASMWTASAHTLSTVIFAVGGLIQCIDVTASAHDVTAVIFAVGESFGCRHVHDECS